MPGKLIAGWLVVMMALSTTGCCRWCTRHCPQCQQQAYQPPPVAYQSAPACCQPAPVCCPASAPVCCPAPAPTCCPAPSGYQPVSQYQPTSSQPGWQRTYNNGPQTCYCQ